MIYSDEMSAEESYFMLVEIKKMYLWFKCRTYLTSINIINCSKKNMFQVMTVPCVLTKIMFVKYNLECLLFVVLVCD